MKNIKCILPAGILGLLFGVAIVLFPILTQAPAREVPQPEPFIDPSTLVPDPAVAELLEVDITDSFAYGQYYFNHDDDPSGPYDRRLARAYYQRALAEDVNKVNGLVRYQLGRIEFIEGRFGEAIVLLDEQAALFGTELPNVYYILGLAYAYRALDTADEADWAAAEDNFIQYLSFDDASPWARTDIAWVFFNQAKFSEMFTYLEPGLAENPNHPWLLNMYGLALLNTGQASEAVGYFEHAKEIVEPYTPTDWGKAYPGNNPADWEQGLEEFKTAIDSNLEVALAEA